MYILFKKINNYSQNKNNPILFFVRLICNIANKFVSFKIWGKMDKDRGIGREKRIRMHKWSCLDNLIQSKWFLKYSSLKMKIR